MMLRTLLPVALLALSVLPVGARDLFVDNLAGYTIEPRVLDAPNCDGPAFNNARLEAFEKGLCVFHRPARSADDTEAAITLLDQAQTAGLPPVHQQLATFVTGLAHCDEAERHLDAFRSTGNKAEETMFCRDRREAQAELDSIRWNNALFDYADGLSPQRTLSARLTEMSACHAGVLASSFDAQCGLISNLSDSEIGAIVDEATEATIHTYFTGVESPITAMFSHKLERTQGLLESAEGGIAGLEDKAAGVNAEYNALNRVYEDARDNKMGPIYDNYRASILRATAILDEFERWKGGLFMTSEGVNLQPKITERSGEIEEELARIASLKFEDKATSLVSDIRRIVNGEEEDRKTIATLCRIYFCELTDRRTITEVIRTCRRPALAQNPLCIGNDGQIKDGKLTVSFDGATSSVDIVDLCRGAGVEEMYTSVNLAPTTTAACLSAIR